MSKSCIHTKSYNVSSVPLVGRHSFQVSRALLLQLYDHTLEVRLWNTKEKLAPQARFDRPQAFRLPIPKRNSKGQYRREGRPSRFSIVGQQTERVSHRRRRRSRILKAASNLSSLSEGDSDLELSASISQ